MRPRHFRRREFLALTGLSTLAATTAVGCGRALGREGVPADTIRYQGWAGVVTPAELAQDLGYLEGLTLKWVGNTTSGPQDIQAAAAGDTDFGGAFNGAVVKMAAAKAPVKAVLSYYGVDKERFSGFYVRKNSPLRNARDLIGKRVAMNTLGAHSEAMLDTYLARAGLSSGEADQVERIALPPVNTEQSLRKGHIDVAVLGDILRDKALEHGGIRALTDDHRLLGTFSAGTYVMAERYLEQHPREARAFVTGVGRALDWSRRTPRDEVIDRMVRVVRRRNRSEDTAPLRYWRSYGVADPVGRINSDELSIWVRWLERRGDIKADRVHIPDIYTNRFNNAHAADPTPARNRRRGSRA